MSQQEKTNKKTNLLKGPIFSTLAFFALPTLLANILQSLNGSVNAIWVGRFLGEHALAATGNATVILFLLFSLIFGFGMAAMVSIARSLGHKDIEKARQYFGAALTLSFSLAIIFTLCGILFSDKILHLLHTDADIFAMAHSYLQTIFFATPAMIIFVISMTALRGIGDSLTPLWFMILNVSLDIALNPLLILGVGPFPRLGITGAACATVVASYISLILFFAYIYYRDIPLRLRGKELGYLWPKFAMLKTLFTQGLAMALQMIVISVASVIFMGRVNMEGVDTLAAFNVMQQVWSYLQMPAMAVGAAVSAMVAQNIGANAWERVFKITRSGMILSLIITGLLLLLMTLFGEFITRLFLGNEPTVIDIAHHIQLLSSWSYIFVAIQMVLSATLRANRAVIFPLITLVICLFPVRSIIYYIFHPMIQADAIWYSFAVTNCLSCILIWIYYKLPYWRRKTSSD